jgi:hypothetical protein
MKNLLPTIFILIAILGCSCDSTTPYVNHGKGLSVIDASCSEIFLKPELSNIEFPAVLNLTINNQRVEQFVVASNDTIIIADSLEAGQEYSLSLFLEDNQSYQIKTSTLNPTSHNFEWETYYLGDCNSVLGNVGIVDENNIFAVYKLHYRDSLGNCGLEKFNIARWDGSTWDVSKVIVPTYPHQYQVAAPLEALLTLDEQNIFVCSAGALMHWDGNKWNERAYFVTDFPFTGQVYSMWGNKNDNIYIGSRDGDIYHFTGEIWSILNTNTNTSITNITGYTNPLTNEIEVLASSSSSIAGTINRLLKISNNGDISLIPWQEESLLTGIYTMNGIKIYVTGPGILEYTKGNWSEVSTNPNVVTSEINGTDYNNIFVIGVLGTIFHFNGIGWENIEYNPNHFYYGLAVQGDMVVVSGQSNDGRAVIRIGRQTK